ncbi:hypothetical protein [Aureimonas psammosilenae]|uniref:hypothetical protein n=1 Tax=Aureimonas psammosilenae TaxID=2495496 RepID=UPI0018699951|nr:hypothetical protein [Aureimonas psammosilenae]
MKHLPAGIGEQLHGHAKRLAELFDAFVMAIATGILLMFATLGLADGSEPRLRTGN